MQLQAARANASVLADRAPVSTRRVDAGASRFRLGYLSSGESDMTSSLTDVLERHDRARCEVFLFGHERAENNPLRARFRNAADRFFNISTLDDERCARRIAESSIDILVDVDGNTEDGRMGIAALRPAPIQVSWLGVPATRGADWYDYIIADRYVAPPGVEPRFAEQVVGLPDCYLSPGRSRPQPTAALARADYGLPADAIVLCCFGEPSTITAPMFALWLRVLSAIPQAILWLADDNALASASLRARAVQHGIAPERLVFAPTRPPIESLARYRVADLAIDTFACVSPSTAADALWMGCPLATLTGDTFASRIATSFLANLGLSELAAVSPARYEELIIDIAGDGARRDALRDRLQHAVSAMPLFDVVRFVQNLERAYAQMITNAGQGTPRAFDLR